MKVQTKILVLLFLIAGCLVGGLIAFRLTERRKYEEIARKRSEQREEMFDQFLTQRGDALKALVDDYTIWDEMVRATVKGDTAWAEQHVTDDTLAEYQINAVWIYKADRTLFYSRNNRYADDLRALPVPPEAIASLLSKERTCHFFVQIPKGWMEIRGGTIQPSNDRFRETAPQGFFFAGQFWITENIRRMSLFTGYQLELRPNAAGNTPPASAEQLGRITFSRAIPGWNGTPVGWIVVTHDSPIIRELNEASNRLFAWLVVFAVGFVLVLAVSLWRWVRRPLRLMSRSLASDRPADLQGMQKWRNEFGTLAQLILRFRSTEEQLHKMEEDLRHAQKLEAVGRLAGGVAHDFNNLLTAIIGYAQLLEQRLGNDPKSLEQVEVIHRAGNQAAGLTRQLLAFSRKQLLEPKVLDLNVILHEMEKLLQRVIGEHIEIVVRTGAVDGRVLADPGQLEQVILNLGVNARDAMPRGGTLTISTADHAAPNGGEAHGDERVEGRFVLLSVRDTGSGMDEATRARIFEPFFTTKGPGRGTGLGLATVYGIVKQSRGAIRVESTPGQGSTFAILLPWVDLPLAAPASTQSPAPAAKGGESILVVEDEEMVRLLVCTVLTEAGYDVACASTPAEALRFAAGMPRIDVLVTDVVMPGMHGPALAQSLAHHRPEMHILYISGYSDNDISDQGFLDPELDVLQKPFTRDALLRKVREVLEGHPVLHEAN